MATYCASWSFIVVCLFSRQWHCCDSVPRVQHTVLTRYDCITLSACIYCGSSPGPQQSQHKVSYISFTENNHSTPCIVFIAILSTNFLLLWNCKVHHLVHKSLSLDHMWSQLISHILHVRDRMVLGVQDWLWPVEPSLTPESIFSVNTSNKNIK